MTANKSSEEKLESPEGELLKNLYHHKKTILQNISSSFFSERFHTIKIGTELEFYLTNLDGSQIFDSQITNNFISDLTARLPKNSLIYKIDKEQGCSQIEVKTTFDSNLLKVCEEIEVVKILAQTLATEKNLCASFLAQPFADDCGSALQFNISLHDSLDQNIFSYDEKLMKKVANSLLQATDDMLILLAPDPKDYDRFAFATNLNLFKKGKFTAPVNLSFGADNRTCAIRIPKKSARLEYRIAAANADPSLCITAILLAILNEKEDAQLQQIHGNAFDEQYLLPKFCQNFDAAYEKFFSESNLIKKRLKPFMSDAAALG